MIELLTSPEAWAGLLTLTALEVVLGIDNVIFISVVVSGIPEHQAKRARQIGLAMALIFRILLLSLLVWLIGLTSDVLTIRNQTFSWRDIILIGGGLFLIVDHSGSDRKDSGSVSGSAKLTSTCLPAPATGPVSLVTQKTRKSSPAPLSLELSHAATQPVLTMTAELRTPRPVAAAIGSPSGMR